MGSDGTDGNHYVDDIRFKVTTDQQGNKMQLITGTTFANQVKRNVLL